MKVILTDEIRGLGTRGEIVTVKDGYARNFLIPKKLAREATTGNLKSIEQEKKKWALLAAQEKDQAQKAADSVKGMKVTIQKRVGDTGQLLAPSPRTRSPTHSSPRACRSRSAVSSSIIRSSRSASTTSKCGCIATSPPRSRSKSFRRAPRSSKRRPPLSKPSLILRRTHGGG